ncbi:MAG: nucleoside hydrolase [Chloroflexota bacterium]
MTRKVILDMDPGHDDALAILLAARHLEVLGITTVHGNGTVEKTTVNTLKILEVAGLTHIPVARGMAAPLINELHTGAMIHGESALDGVDLPEPTTPLDARDAVTFIIETVRAHEGVTLVPTGPLTNVATALRRAPDIAGRIPEISLMGGSAAGGNITASAEANIYHDPEAAHIVFSSGVPIKMAGLDITRQAAATAERRERMRALGNRTGQVAAAWLDFYAGRLELLHHLDSASLHDVVSVAWLIDPTLIQSKTMHVVVELKGEHTRGMTVCDRRPGVDVDDDINRRLPPNTEVGLTLEVERFFEQLITTLATYP